MLHKTFTRLLAASAVLLAIPPHLARAADADAVAERFKTVMLLQGTDVEWDDVSGDGVSTIVLEGVNVRSAGLPGRIGVGDVTFHDIEETDGGYQVGEVTVAPTSFVNEGVSVELAEISFTDVTLPATGAAGPYGEMIVYATAELPELSVKMADKKVFSLVNFNVEVDGVETGRKLTFAGSAESFAVDLSLVEDANSKAAIEALGYSVVTGNAIMNGSWDPADGRAILDRYDITVDNAGTLGMTVDIAGYTPDLIKSLQQIQAKMATASEEEQASQGIAMLGLMQQLTLHGASLRFDDDTLTQKAMTFIAEKQGVQPSDIANQAKALLPFMLAQLNNPELAAAVSQAVGEFLDDPRNLRVTLAPANPVPFALIAAGAMAAPQSLPQQLGLTVSAND